MEISNSLAYSTASEKPQHKTPFNYFDKIGDTNLQSALQSSLQSSLESIFNAFSLSTRLLYQYGSHSIVKGNFLDEIECSGFINEIQDFIKIWTARVETTYESFTNDLIGLYSEQYTVNLPMQKSLIELRKYKDKHINATTPFDQQNLALDKKLDILHDISTYKLTETAKRTSFWEKSFNEFTKNFQAIKSKHNYLYVTSASDISDCDQEQISYEGECYNGRLFGYGILYYPNGLFWKQGTFKDNKLDGENCLEYNANGTIYHIGSYKNDLRHGYGRQYDNDGNLCKKGVFLNGKANSENFKKYYNWGNQEYEGSVVNNLFEGYGELYYTDGELKYKGPFLRSKPHGDNGTFYCKKTSKVKYSGSVTGGLYNGKGTLYDEYEQEVESGLFVNGLFSHGFVNRYNQKSLKLEYSGEYIDYMYNGRGVQYHENGQKSYQGNFFNGNEYDKEILKYDSKGNICFIGYMEDGIEVGESENFVDDENQGMLQREVNRNIDSSHDVMAKKKNQTILLIDRNKTKVSAKDKAAKKNNQLERDLWNCVVKRTSLRNNYKHNEARDIIQIVVPF